ncbi:structural constituent of ribosome [Spatholobus suberectus]|nr:structural constituent of ribosome [Spatholobus suberectus]
MDFYSEHFWIFLSKLLNTLFRVFAKVSMRFYGSEAMKRLCSSQFSRDNEQAESIHSESENFGVLTDTVSHESDQIDSNGCQKAAESVEKFCSETVHDGGNFGLEEEETTKLVFKFEYQKWNCNYDEEFKGGYGESSDFVKGGDAVSASTNKYEFISGKSFSHFLDEPEAEKFTVKECFVDSNGAIQLENHVGNDFGFLTRRKLVPENCEGGVNAENLNNFTESAHKEVSEKFKDVQSIEQPVEPVVHNFLSEDDFICSSSDSDSVISSLGEGFLSDTDFGTTNTLGSNAEENVGLTEEDMDFGDEKIFENLDVGYEPDDFAEEDDDIMDELGKLEEECGLEKSSGSSFEDSNSINSKPEQSLKPNSQTLTTFDLEDSNRFDTLWEHQDLIEQLKMELKKVRATGLPTILEDSESPRIMEDLKPWKIDEKLQHGSTTNELPKFYRSYRERMRKFDILNYQKMYAIGFLQSKDPLQSFSTRKNPSPAFTYILPRGFCLSRRKHTAADPMKKFIRELYSDLEMVYVGQLCLSWEFLQWEYEKALKLWESDQYGLLRFNEVAGEFQQFQVLLQRFIENEPFQGPRVENYAKNRCAMRNLLQVPVIREDNAKDKRKFRKREADKDAIKSDMLVEILEESIRTIWRFIRADKDASSLALKGLWENQVELQDPSDSELLAEIRTNLQKKEKRLRELLRSGSCILKKFQKHHEDGADQVLYFFSQVDMKLVWRVLNMSRITTDQLAWCRSKLSKINFVNRRIHVEPSFLLFPS